MYNKIFDKITVDSGLKQKIEERIDGNMNNKKHFAFKTAALAACLALALSAGAFAAYRYLTAGQAARELGDEKLALSLDGGEIMNVAAEEAPYRAALLGTCSGKNLSDFGGSDGEISPERTYAVLAIERTDGREMTYDDNITVSPLIQGLDPMRYSIFSLGGGSSSTVIDGVMYRIVECDSIECLADRQLYLAVYEGLAPNSAYAMDADTGIISPKADYDGVNMLLELNLDPAKADPAKAQALIDRVEIRTSGEDNGNEPEDEAERYSVVEGDPRLVETAAGAVSKEDVFIIEQNY